ISGRYTLYFWAFCCRVLIYYPCDAIEICNQIVARLQFRGALVVVTVFLIASSNVRMQESLRQTEH
ncbi:MAG: hypothetical protein KAH38_04500, partial [Candidatus Hydrogenedentes bacterium]|nr:hypothetical protein [Candidatus Hydrogenedentota bacterium]